MTRRHFEGVCRLRPNIDGYNELIKTWLSLYGCCVCVLKQLSMEVVVGKRVTTFYNHNCCHDMALQLFKITYQLQFFFDVIFIEDVFQEYKRNIPSEYFKSKHTPCPTIIKNFTLHNNRRTHFVKTEIIIVYVKK